MIELQRRPTGRYFPEIGRLLGRHFYQIGVEMKTGVFHFHAGPFDAYPIQSLGLFGSAGEFVFRYDGDGFSLLEGREDPRSIVGYDDEAFLLSGWDEFSVSAWGDDGKISSSRSVEYRYPLLVDGSVFYVENKEIRKENFVSGSTLCRVSNDCWPDLITDGRHIFSVDKADFLHCYDLNLQETWTTEVAVGPLAGGLDLRCTAGRVHAKSNSIVHLEWLSEEEKKYYCAVSRCSDTGRVRWRRVLSERCFWAELDGNEIFFLHGEVFLVLDADTGEDVASGPNPYGDARRGMYFARVAQYFVFLSTDVAQNQSVILLDAVDIKKSRALRFPEELCFQGANVLGVQRYQGALLISLKNPGLELLYSSLLVLGDDLANVDDDFIMNSLPPRSVVEVIKNGDGENEYRVRATQTDLPSVLLMGAWQIKWIGYMHHFGRSKIDKKQNGTVHWQVDFSHLPDDARPELEGMAGYLEKEMRINRYKPGMPRKQYHILVEEV